jgi:hypothetical protein
MHTITIDASPKQLNKLKKGHPVRVKRGTGFNLIVHPETYHRIARTYDKDKGFQLSLSPQELEANQGIAVSPEMHEMKSEAMPTPISGKGIFNKSGIKAPSTNYMRKAGIENAVSNALSDKSIIDQIKARINLPARNMGQGPKEGPMDYVEYLRNPEDSLNRLNDFIMGEGLHKHEVGSIGLKGSMIHPYLPQAMQSQPYGTNFHMQFMLPPQYRKYNDGTTHEGILGTGMNQHPGHVMTHLPPALQSQPNGANFFFKNFLPVPFQEIHNSNPHLVMGNGIHHHASGGLYASGRAPHGGGLYI